MKLYKYFFPERLDILQTLKIRFTQPNEFNDPFDSNPYYFNNFPIPFWKEITEIVLEDNNITDESKVLIRQSIKDGEFQKFLLKSIRKLTDMIHASTIVVLSLTERFDYLLMWSHYAKSHEGFVVGFDSKHTFFKSAKYSLYNLTKVIYSHKSVI